KQEPVAKQAGDRLLSGSFVAAGSGGYQAMAVGNEAYARKLAAEARRFTVVRSELIDGIHRILRYVTWAIVPVAVLTMISQLHAGQTTKQALTGTVAALVGMVPQGLVLLTSVAFGVAAITLARPRPRPRSGRSQTTRTGTRRSPRSGRHAHLRTGGRDRPPCRSPRRASGAP